MNESERESVEGPGFTELLAHLAEARGFDFSGYKRGGLARRVHKRVHALALASYCDYLDYLQVHPDEFDHLFNAILINVTSFFRDPTAWEFVAEQVVPRLIENRQNGGVIRVWSAGCASGQEAYSIAMLLAEAMGMPKFLRTVKVYATDVDDVALTRARQAVYFSKDLTNVPPALLEKYFEPNNGHHALNKDVRRAVIFGRHNLFFDAPISRIDLLLCRNTLMYFNADAQEQILSSLHFALAEEGVLFLGMAEMLLTHGALFSPLEIKRRLFTKIAPSFPRARTGHGIAVRRTQAQLENGVDVGTIREVAFEMAPLPQLGIDMERRLVVANERARSVLGVLAAEIGRPIAELSLCRKVETLRAGVSQAIEEGRTVHLAGSEWLRSNGDEPQYYDIVATPLASDEGTALGVVVSLLDVTPSRKIQEELQQTTLELEGVYEELQSGSEELQTTNEELQSTVEELETTNEELLSTNEELETTNEELLSTNEELQHMNEELRLRSSELSELSLYFESILTNLKSAVIVVDLLLRVQVWSARTQELWGLRADEVRSKSLLSLDIGLPLEQLLPRIHSCMDGRHNNDFGQLTLLARNRRGRAIECQVALSCLTQDGRAKGVILLMDARDATTGE